VVIGGYFSYAGDVRCNNVACLDPVTGKFSPIGNDPPQRLGAHVRALAALPNGDLVIGGYGEVAPVAIGYVDVFRQSTQQWSSLGSGVVGPSVNALAALPNGDILLGGQFTSVDGVPANSLARWDAATGQWTAMGTGASNTVYSLKCLTNGDVLAGGSFRTIDGVSANRIARWESATGQWNPLGPGLSSQVNAVDGLPNGHVVTGGRFIGSGSTILNKVGAWDGESWLPFSTGVTNPSPSANLEVFAVAGAANGDIFAGGAFLFAGTVVANGIARWDGEQWHPLGSGLAGNDIAGIFTLCALPGGDLIAGGNFTRIGGLPARNIARWNGQNWSIVGARSPDINTDGQVDDADFLLFLDQYNLMLCADPLMPDACSADFNQDGFVDDADFTIFIPAYNAMLVN